MKKLHCQFRADFEEKSKWKSSKEEHVFPFYRVDPKGFGGQFSLFFKFFLFFGEWLTFLDSDFYQKDFLVFESQKVEVG